MAFIKPSFLMSMVAFSFFIGINLASDSSRMLSTYVGTNDQCVTCINNSQYFCAYSLTSTSGYCCTYSELSSDSNCGYGSSYYECTSDSDYSSYGGYILCPTDYSACGTQSYSFSYNTSYNYYSNYFDTSKVCVYEASMTSYSIDKAEVSMTYLDNANAYVYKESSSGTLTYETALSSGDDHTVSISSYYDKVWVVVVPYSSNAYTLFSVETNYDGYSSSVSSGLSGGAIAGIVIGSVAFICCIIGLSVWSSYMRRKRQLEAINNISRAQARAFEIQSQQQPSQVILQSQPQMMQPMPMYADNSAFYGYPGQPMTYDPNMGMQMFDPNITPQTYDANYAQPAYPAQPLSPRPESNIGLASAQTQPNANAKVV